MAQIDRVTCDNGMTPNRRNVETLDITLSAVQWGKQGNPPLVLLHGITSSAASWWRLGPELAHMGYHVTAFDMPGHGLSGDSVTHTIPQIAAHIIAGIRALGIDNFTLIGHSWGGATAATIALNTDRPEMHQLVLVDPSLGMTPERGHEVVDNYMVGVGEPPEITLPRLETNNPGWHPCDRFWKTEALSQCRAPAVRGFFLESGEWNLAEQLGTIAVPMLLLVADERYTVISPERLEQARAGIHSNRSEVVVVPESEHSMFRRGYEPTMAVLRRWLDGGA